MRWPITLALITAVAFGVGYAAGMLSERQGCDLRAAKGEIETRVRIDDALANPDGCSWSERLLGACGD